MKLLNRYFFAGIGVGMVLTVAAIVGLVFWYYQFTSGIPGREPPYPASEYIQPRGRADLNWKLKQIDGTVVSLQDMKGSVIFLNLWATWCGPCVAEMPSIQKLHDSMKGQDVRFVLVSDEDVEVIGKFAKKQGFEIPFYSSASEMPATYSRDGVPLTYIIGRSGEIFFHHLGKADWSTEASQSFLRAVLSH